MVDLYTGVEWYGKEPIVPEDLDFEEYNRDEDDLYDTMEEKYDYLLKN